MRPPSLPFPGAVCIAMGSRKRSPSARLDFFAWECSSLYSAALLLPEAARSLVPAAGAVLSLWIWRRFGLWYAFLAAMIFAVWLSGYWTSSDAAQRAIVAVFYVVGLICVAALRTRHRFDYLEDAYSLAEALLWLGIYLAINLMLSPSNLLHRAAGLGRWQW